MNESLINELRSIELFAEDLRQKCYRARKKLEGVLPPAPSSKKKKALSEQDVSRLLASRKKTTFRKTGH